MKRLLVLRHAKSSWSDPALDDHDRPLSLRGLRDAPRMAERIRGRGLDDARILTSTARRALETALALTRAHGARLELIEDRRIYHAAPHSLLGLLAAQSADITTIVLVGHNPGLTQLVNMLLPDMRLANLPTAGVVTMTLDLDDWADIGAARGKLEHYDYPRREQTR